MAREYNIPEKYKGKTIYSISRINAHNGCEHEYYLNYILRKVGRDNIYGKHGGVVHELCENLQKGLIDNKEALTEYENRMLAFKLAGYEFPTEKTEKSVVESLKHYFKNHQTINGNVELEKEVYIEMLDYVFVGFIDIVEYNEDGSVNIGDYKTSSKFQAKDLDEKAFQLMLYAIGMEQLGYKVNKLYWNMQKYCTISWSGKTTDRTRVCERHEWVAKIVGELNKDLKDLSPIEKEMLLNTAVDNNNLDSMPEFIKNKYKVTDFILEYPYTEDKKDLLYHYISSNISMIESKSDSEDEWIGKEITDTNNYYCTVLCGQRNNCKYYKKFLEQQENKEPLVSNDIGSNTIDMFKLFS